MGLFDKTYTTGKIYIGTPEAEAEVNNKARVQFNEVFSDYLDVIPELETEKFIVVGRKGSGKTAIGQYLMQQSKNEPNKFCEFIRKNDIDLEDIVQICSANGQEIQKELLFKWIILTRMLKMITQNEAVQHLKEIKLLQQFLIKNSGYIEIDKYEIKEVVKTNGFTIAIEYLSRFFKGSGNKEFKLTGTKAEFYKLIPYLEDAIKSVLTNPIDQSNSYYLVFDDLDVDFTIKDPASIDTVLNLVRISREYNNNFFSENNINAKVILLLRDDIGDVLIKRSADMAKIFSSYSINLRWYEHDLYKIDENLLKLKKFIDRRLQYGMDKAGIPITNSNPWATLIKADHEVNETSFKYVIDHTFYSPRDLILLFKPLQTFSFPLPLSLYHVNKLIARYVTEVKAEIDNALAIYLSPLEIKRIWEILQLTARKETFTYEFLIAQINQFSFNYEPEVIATFLFDYSLIGNKVPSSKMVKFKYRENANEYFTLNQTQELLNHRMVTIYLKQNSI